MKLMMLPTIYLDKIAGKGRAVFTRENIPPSTIIEVAPVIVMKKEDRLLLDKTLLHDYIFEWGHRKDKCCMALGYVPVYNHSYRSNCEYEMDFDTDTITIRSVRFISEGEELTINYNGDWNDSKKVWFDVKE
jgi:SET domain-containing protein